MFDDYDEDMDDHQAPFEDLHRQAHPEEIDHEAFSAAAAETIREQATGDEAETFGDTRPHELEEMFPERDDEEEEEIDAGSGYQPDVSGTGLASDDPVTADEMPTAIRHSWGSTPADGKTPEEQYDDLPVNRVSLRTLKQQYEHHNVEALLAHLPRATKIDIPDDWLIPPSSHTLYPTSYEADLDYLYLFPKRGGCQLLLPRSATQFNYSFTLNLHDRNSQFRNKKADPIFDPTGRAIRIGKHQGLNAYLLLVPNEVLEQERPDSDSVPKVSGNTSLPRPHFLALAVCIARAVKSVPGTTIYCHDDYPDITDEPAFHRRTNILKNFTQRAAPLELGYAHMVAVDKGLRDWSAFVTAMPVGWPKEELAKSTPVVALLRYGQNQRIHLNGQDVEIQQEQAETFNALVKWDEVKYTVFAIACGIRAYRLMQWDRVPNADLRQKHGDDFYISKTRNEADKVGLSEHPLRTPSGVPIPLYDGQGATVMRLKAAQPTAEDECSILLNLKKAIRVFSTPTESAYDDLNWDYPPPTRTVRLSPYSIGSLGGHGNVQFTGVSAAVAKFIAKLNRTTVLEVMGEELHDDNPGVEDDDIVIPAATIPPIEGLNTQLYHTVAHGIRESTGSNRATQGVCTAVATGSYWVLDRPDFARATRAREVVGEDALPHHHLQDQVKSGEVPLAFRHETVYSVNMAQLGNRDGTWLWFHFILALATILRTGSVFTEIKQCMTVFVPRIFPQLLAYACAPWSTALELLFHIVRTEWARNGKNRVVIDPVLCNMISCIERVLAFHVTGNWRVLTRRLMDPLWMTLGILKTGVASLHPNIIISKLFGLRILDPALWPINPATSQPYSAVTASILYTYGAQVNDHFDAVSLIQSARWMHVPDQIAERTRNERNLGSITMIIRRVVSVLMAAIVSDVRTAIDNEIGPETLHPRSHLRKRQVANERWANMERPLAWENNMSFLLTALQENSGEELTDLPLSYVQDIEDKQYARQLLVSVLGHTGPNSPGRAAYPRKLFPLVLKAAVAEVKRLEVRRRADVLGFFADILAAELGEAGIHFVPGPASQGATSVVPRAWTRLTSPARPVAQRLDKQIMNEAQALKRARDEKATTQSLANPSAKWSIMALGYKAFRVALQKTSLPEEWDAYPSANTAKELNKDDHLSFVQADWPIYGHNNFDITNPLYRMAIFIVIAYTLQHPDTYTKDDGTLNTVTPLNFQSRMHASKWYPMTDGFGINSAQVKKAAVMVPLLAMYFVAIYDDEHPIGRIFHNTETHVTSETPPMPKSFTSKFNNLKVRLQDLAHMGLLKSYGIAIFKSAKHTKTWERISKKDLNAKFERWQKAVLEDEHEGAFMITSDLFGRENAEKIMAKEDQRYGIGESVEPPANRQRTE